MDAVIKPVKGEKKELLDKNIAFRKLRGSDICEKKEERAQLDKKESHSGWDSARSGFRLLCASHLNIFTSSAETQLMANGTVWSQLQS